MYFICLPKLQAVIFIVEPAVTQSSARLILFDYKFNDSDRLRISSCVGFIGRRPAHSGSYSKRCCLSVRVEKSTPFASSPWIHPILSVARPHGAASVTSDHCRRQRRDTMLAAAQQRGACNQCPRQRLFYSQKYWSWVRVFSLRLCLLFSGGDVAT